MWSVPSCRAWTSAATPQFIFPETIPAFSRWPTFSATVRRQGRRHSGRAFFEQPLRAGPFIRRRRAASQPYRHAGAVATVCRLDLKTGMLSYTGVGNVSMKLVGRQSEQMVTTDGVIVTDRSARMSANREFIPEQRCFCIPTASAATSTFWNAPESCSKARLKSRPGSANGSVRTPTTPPALP